METRLVKRRWGDYLRTYVAGKHWMKSKGQALWRALDRSGPAVDWNNNYVESKQNKQIIFISLQKLEIKKNLDA